jgi:hypothetical protein
MAECGDSEDRIARPENDYRRLAKRALQEAEAARKKGDELGARQAAEKAYLACVHAARQVVLCSGKKFRRKQQSSAAIARAWQIFGELKLKGDSKVEVIREAFSKALQLHGACFYDGFCTIRGVVEAARLTDRAMKHVPVVCCRIERLMAPAAKANPAPGPRRPSGRRISAGGPTRARASR